MKKINEIFYSLQGEGFYTGRAAVFVRFSGCNLKCDFCDTQHEEGVLMSDEDIVKEIGKYPTDFIVITGGEPSLWIDKELVDKLHTAGKYVAIETNGTNKVPAGIDWVTCSPKNNSDLKPDRIDELKIVYTGDNDLEKYEKTGIKHLYLQPCSCKNTKQVVEYILAHPVWQLSLQTHKLINIQ